MTEVDCSDSCPGKPETLLCGSQNMYAVELLILCLFWFSLLIGFFFFNKTSTETSLKEKNESITAFNIFKKKSFLPIMRYWLRQCILSMLNSIFFSSSFFTAALCLGILWTQ